MNSLVDMSHISELVAAGVLPSPVPHAQFVTSTTCKSLMGPRRNHPVWPLSTPPPSIGPSFRPRRASRPLANEHHVVVTPGVSLRGIREHGVGRIARLTHETLSAIDDEQAAARVRRECQS